MRIHDQRDGVSGLGGGAAHFHCALACGLPGREGGPAMLTVDAQFALLMGIIFTLVFSIVRAALWVFIRRMPRRRNIA
jgi:hypothetical protein